MPEVRHGAGADGPGAEEDDTELRDLTRRLWVSAALSVPLVLLAMAPMFGCGHDAIQWLELALATPVVLWGGWPFFRKFWLSLQNRSLEHVHADRPGRRRSPTSTAWSRCSRPACSRTSSACTSGEVGAYFEAAAVIVTLVMLGEVMQLRAMGQTSQAIRAAACARAQHGAAHRARRPEREVPLE